MTAKFTSFLAACLLLAACRAQEPAVDKSIVAELDLTRYLGTWYEIARFDHRFERGLTGVTATYTLRPDGLIRVLNAGYRDSLSGPLSEAEGKAKIPDPKRSAALKVSFFWFFYADYLVLELDPDYQWAAIGSRSDNYLWILSRTPQMDGAVYTELMERLRKRGYAVEKLLMVPQAPASGS